MKTVDVGEFTKYVNTVLVFNGRSKITDNEFAHVRLLEQLNQGLNNFKRKHRIYLTTCAIFRACQRTP